MQWRYLFIVKSPRFQAARKSIRLFTFLIYNAAPSQAISDFVLPMEYRGKGASPLLIIYIQQF